MAISAGKSASAVSSPRPKKRSEAAPDKKSVIRNAAFLSFSRHGYHQTTVDNICAAAGVSKGSFYWYYESKQALFLDILELWAHQVDALLTKQFEAALASKTPFEDMTRALEREAKRNRRIIPIWLDSLSQLSKEPEIQAGLARFHRSVRTTLTRLLKPALYKGMSDADGDALSGCMMACFMGLLCQDQVDPKGASFTTQIRFFMQTLQMLVEQSQRARKRS